MKSLALAALLATTPAHAALVEVPFGTQTCTLSVDLIRCSGVAPQPTPRPTVAPEPTTVLVGGCPRDARDLNSPLPAQPTLRGYDLDTSGRQTWAFCARPTSSTTRGGNLGAVWYDPGGAQCTQALVRLTSYNGRTVPGGSTGWGGTPQLTYKFLFGGVAPPGEYFFEVFTDSTACGDRGGRVRVLWTP